MQADGKVLSYTDWTATLDWAGKLQATLGEGLPYAYFTAPNVGGGGQVMQLVTADALKNKGAAVQIWAIDPNTGQRINGAASGTGPVLLEISYSVADQVNGQAVTNTVDNFYGLYLPTGVRWALSGNSNGMLTADLTTALNYFSVAALPSLPSGQTAASFYPKAFSFFKQSAYAFVTGSSSSFTYEVGLDPVTKKAGEVTTTYVLSTAVKEGSTTAQPLQALFLNQALNLSADELASPALTSYTYASPRGTMTIWNGSVFHAVLQYDGSLPEVPPLPTAINTTGTAPQDAHPDAWLWSNYLLPLLRSVSTATQVDGSLTLSNIFPNSNNCFEGQSMYGVMQLVPILLEVANSSDTQLTARDKAQANNLAGQVYNQVKDRMSDWLSASDAQGLKLLYYQPSQTQETAKNAPPLGSPGWDSVMSILSGFLSSESLNDHNLIGGYFIKTAALIAQYDSTWGDSQTLVTTGRGTKTLLGAMGDVVNQIVQDVSNYNRSNPDFPFLRNFDVYQGHSWVDGAANNLVGNNQESSSESLNYASGLIMWGEATGNTALRDLGVYLYTTEVDTANTYYFNVKGTSAFPTQYTQYTDPKTGKTSTVRTLVTFLLGNGGAYQGFIGPNTTNVAGIQVLPLGGSSYYLGADPNFVSQTYDLAIQGGFAKGDVPLTPPTYLSVIYPYEALTNADAALDNYLNNLPRISQINGGDLQDHRDDRHPDGAHRPGLLLLVGRPAVPGPVPVDPRRGRLRRLRRRHQRDDARLHRLQPGQQYARLRRFPQHQRRRPVPGIAGRPQPRPALQSVRLPARTEERHDHHQDLGLEWHRSGDAAAHRRRRGARPSLVPRPALRLHGDQRQAGQPDRPGRPGLHRPGARAEPVISAGRRPHAQQQRPKRLHDHRHLQRPDQQDRYRDLHARRPDRSDAANHRGPDLGPADEQPFCRRRPKLHQPV
ncbi:MAG TPA: glycosyl hydrolase [Gemmataceae bacterium]|nr:glycosyl hydrolase [Gemmataceae bacterium]